MIEHGVKHRIPLGEVVLVRNANGDVDVNPRPVVVRVAFLME
jgi:hypothetical protein